MSRPGSASEILEGVGVHTGAPCRLELRRRDGDGGGIRFFAPGSSEALSPLDIAAAGRRAAYSTVLEGGTWIIRTPEHLLAALLFFSGCPLDVQWDGPELPIFDGSALVFRGALSRLFPDRAGAPAWIERESDLRWEDEWDGGHLRVRPAERFSAVCILERGPLREKAVLASPGQAWNEVLPARTFLFHGEWERLRGPGSGPDGEGGSGGMLRGATAEAGLLLAETPELHARALADHPEWRGGPFPLLNQPAWRMSGEAARHKLLDLLGDLALAGLWLPRIEVEIRNGGHAAHHRLVEKVISYAAG
jgi:UDP-3-O-[3-hydroxymyristoyl] N-acetylglucosamine deacetylase/3-hydroxyacyl-[acyl-carrier-protein] dehydratase